jgi:hypothetical protein
VAQVIYEERGIFAPQIVNVEATTQVQKSHNKLVNKEIPKVMVHVQESQVDIFMQLQHERPVKIPVVYSADYTVQVPSHQAPRVEKQILRIVPMANLVHQEVPHSLTSSA